MAEFTSVYGKDYSNGTLHYDWKEPDSGYTLKAGNVGGTNCVMVIRLELPTDAQSVTLRFFNAGLHYRLSSLRYKLTTAEDSSLVNANDRTECDGKFTLASMYDQQMTEVTIEKVLKKGVHFIYIWTDNSSDTSNYMQTRFYSKNGFSAEYEELLGIAYFEDGSSHFACEVHIEDGTSYSRYAPYVDNGIGFEIVN